MTEEIKHRDLFISNINAKNKAAFAIAWEHAIRNSCTNDGEMTKLLIQKLPNEGLKIISTGTPNIEVVWSLQQFSDASKG